MRVETVAGRRYTVRRGIGAGTENGIVRAKQTMTLQEWMAIQTE
jgi:hypothetical protein